MVVCTFSMDHIPMEIWYCILGLVVRLPGSKVIDKGDPFTAADRHYDETTHHGSFYANVVLDRKNLSAVCRTFQQIVSAIACEYLYVDSYSSLYSTVEMLRRNHERSGGRGIGLRTRRIDMALPGRKDKTDVFNDIFQLTPNLQIFINGNHDHSRTISCTPHSLVSALVRYCGTSLRRVEWVSTEGPSMESLEALCHGAPDLQTLHISHMYIISPYSIPPLVLRSLRNLSLGNSKRHPGLDSFIKSLSFSPEQLPSLQRLQVEFMAELDFLEVHGSKLLSFRIHSQMTTLPQALRLCPNLQSLIISPGIGMTEFDSHRSIQRIGIFPGTEDPVRVPLTIYRMIIVTPVYDFLLSVEQACCPNLTQVRIRNVGYMQDLLDEPTWLTGLWRRLGLRGVSLEDKNGLPINQAVDGM